jgi:hypothetical protein
VKKNLEKIGTAAAVRFAMKAHHQMIVDRICVKCYEPNDLENSAGCSKCVEEYAAWNRREAAMLAELAAKSEAK